MDVSALSKCLREFAAARNWEQFHSPKNLAMALSAEAGELLEIFQWLSEKESQTIVGPVRNAVAQLYEYQFHLREQLKLDGRAVLMVALDRHRSHAAGCAAT